MDMFTLSSPHNHTPYCDGKSSAEDMVLSAIKHGFLSLGFSSHAKQDFDVFYAMDEEREVAYIKEVKQLREKYKDQIKIWLGMERDSYSYADRASFDYVMGSVHYLPMPDGTKIPVDGPLDMVKGAIDQHFGGDALLLAGAYYARLGEYIRDYKPNIIGHFDLIMKNNRQGQLFDAASPHYIKAATEAMDEAITGCNLLEINTGGMARHGASVPYPTPDLLAYWRQIGGQVIVAADCHQAEQIAFGYEMAARMVKEAGYQKAAMLGRHDELFDWIEVN